MRATAATIGAGAASAIAMMGAPLPEVAFLTFPTDSGFGFRSVARTGFASFATGNDLDAIFFRVSARFAGRALACGFLASLADFVRLLTADFADFALDFPLATDRVAGFLVFFRTVAIFRTLQSTNQL